MEAGPLKIGQLAARAGVPTATVRYYERRGLIAPAPRTATGYRAYGPETVRRLRFIKHAQELGFTLEEVQAMLELQVEDPAACARVEATTRAKIQTVRKRLAELRRLERTLERLARACEQQPPSDPCPVLVALADDAGDGVPRVARGARANA